MLHYQFYLVAANDFYADFHELRNKKQ